MKFRATYLLLIILMLILPISVFAQSSGPLLAIDLCDDHCFPVPPSNPETSPGSIIRYMIFVCNAGDELATNVLFHAVIPMYTTFDPLGTYGWNCTGHAEGDTCVFNNGTMYTMDCDSHLFTVKVDDLLPCDLEYIENTIYLTYDGSTPSPWHSYTLRHKVNITGACIPTPSTSLCPTTPRYYMYTLEDVNQPAGWQPYCYIISANGYPSVQIQARLCTPPGSQHTFKATNIPYGGWVYSDCLGNASYGWPYWSPSWYRPEYANNSR
jgi:uncharacterized repeat protein (TIGR01451 family)